MLAAGAWCGALGAHSHEGTAAGSPLWARNTAAGSYSSSTAAQQQQHSSTAAAAQQQQCKQWRDKQHCLLYQQQLLMVGRVNVKPHKMIS
jgi:hypothetical protein